MRYACICMYTHDNIPKMNQTYQTSVKIECQSNNANKSEKTVECLSILSVNFIKDFFRGEILENITQKILERIWKN